MQNHSGAPAAVFLKTMPDVAYEGSNVHIISLSGREAFEKVMLRSLWRRFLEREIRRLNEIEAAEQGRVVEAERMNEHRRRKRAPAGGAEGRQRTCPD